MSTTNPNVEGRISYHLAGDTASAWCWKFGAGLFTTIDAHFGHKKDE